MRRSPVLSFSFASMLLFPLLTAGTARAQSDPFASLVGSWKGTGQVTLDNGSKERIRCVAVYNVRRGGNQLLQNLRCASDSYNFELRADVENRGGVISGMWQEVRRNITGTLSGKTQGSRVLVSIDGPAFNAALTLQVRGQSQYVTIKSEGTAMTGVTITLNRS